MHLHLSLRTLAHVDGSSLASRGQAYVTAVELCSLSLNAPPNRNTMRYTQ
jgi:hypothetical protein